MTESYSSIAMTESYSSIAMTESYSSIAMTESYSSIATTESYSFIAMTESYSSIAMTGSYSSIAMTGSYSFIAMTGSYSSIAMTESYSSMSLVVIRFPCVSKFISLGGRLHSFHWFICRGTNCISKVFRISEIVTNKQNLLLLKREFVNSKKPESLNQLSLLDDV
ncbi:hypothetical protein BgiMline_018552 [Biomphalaria glabrata]|nr:hypothetical protein BgiMline_006167 [Biomphalaria glabrata]